jgi:hypothetical protein
LYCSLLLMIAALAATTSGSTAWSSSFNLGGIKARRGDRGGVIAMLIGLLT